MTTSVVLPAEVLSDAMSAAFPEGPPEKLGVAVSGGGDSMALLKLLADWGAVSGTQIQSATVDHGLRPEAGGEAQLVAKVAETLGVGHEILHWKDWDGQGNLQAKARQARISLLSDWATRHDLPAICMAHTKDDQAETVLLRLARGSGVDGLSGMRAERHLSDRLRLLRPLLSLRRAQLRAYLREQKISWAEDPSNTDLAFGRVRARAVLADPPLAGLDVETLNETALRMAAARRVLEKTAFQAACETLDLTPYGAIQLDAARFWALEDDTRWRLLSHSLKVLSANPYRPRLTALRQALNGLKAGQTTSLHGCLMVSKSKSILVQREPSQTAGVRCNVPGVWDNHWKISGSCGADHHVRALGQEGWEQLTRSERTSVPHSAALALPSIWSDAELCAVALLKETPEWSFKLLLDVEDVRAAMLSH